MAVWLQKHSELNLVPLLVQPRRRRSFAKRRQVFDAIDARWVQFLRLCLWCPWRTSSFPDPRRARELPRPTTATVRQI